MSNELKPCPFCGGEAEIAQYYNITEDTYCICAGCTQCGATVEETDDDHASELWNRRTVNVDELGKIADEMAGGNVKYTDYCSVEAAVDDANDYEAYVARRIRKEAGL